MNVNGVSLLIKPHTLFKFSSYATGNCIIEIPSPNTYTYIHTYVPYKIDR